jgi:hypothetical protein
LQHIIQARLVVLQASVHQLAAGLQWHRLPVDARQYRRVVSALRCCMKEEVPNNATKMLYIAVRHLQLGCCLRVYSKASLVVSICQFT